MAVVVARAVLRARDGVASLGRYRRNGQYAAIGRWLLTAAIAVVGAYVVWGRGD